jgi:hypothetical protein
MMAGTWLMAGLLLAAAGTPDEVVYLNQRAIKIPLDIPAAQRQQIHQLVLYSSTDQGRTWHQYAVASPEQDAFKFYAPADGLYWFTVEVLDRSGNRTPQDIYQAPPSQKIIIDSLKPQLRIVSARRQDDEVEVTWETQEDHPDLDSLKLEYRPADAPPSAWYTATLEPKLNGVARFKPGGTGPVAVRLRVQDLAKNLATAETEVPAAAGVTTAGLRAPDAAGSAVIPTAASAPGALAIEKPPAAKSETNPPAPAAMPEPPARSASDAALAGSAPSEARAAGRETGADGPAKVVATSERSEADLARPEHPERIARRGPLPPLQLVHSKEVTLEYKLEKVGPSGVGKVELYLTEDEGQTWKLYAEDPEPKPALPGGRLQRTVPLPAEGVFGIRLLVYSRAALAAHVYKQPPKPGDVPQMRIEVDTTPPVAELLAPTPDPTRRDCLVLSWNAHDPNHHDLAAKPITLQWSEQEKGPWQTIEAGLPNSGRYTWQLPASLPDSVYLRLIVRDAAGNESIAQTAKPQIVDLSDPEGVLLGVVNPAP